MTTIHFFLYFMRLFAAKSTKPKGEPDRTNNKELLFLCYKVPVFLCKAISEQAPKEQNSGGLYGLPFQRFQKHIQNRKGFPR